MLDMTTALSFYLEVNCFNTGVKACHSEILFYVHDIDLFYKDIYVGLDNTIGHDIVLCLSF